MAWANKRTLWEDAMSKAPGHARPPATLALDLAWGSPVTPANLEVALNLLKKSLSLYKPAKFLEAGILGNIGSIYIKKGEDQKGIKFYEQAIKIDPLFIKVRYDLASQLVLMGRMEEAIKHADIIIAKGSGRSDYFYLKGLALLWQNRPEDSLPYLRKALSLAPNKAHTLLNMGVCLTLMGKYNSGLWFLSRAARLATRDINPLLSLIENRVRAKDLSGAKQYVNKLLSLHNIKAIKYRLEILHKNFSFAPVSKEFVTPVIEEILLEISRGISIKQ